MRSWVRIISIRQSRYSICLVNLPSIRIWCISRQQYRRHGNRRSRRTWRKWRHSRETRCLVGSGGGSYGTKVQTMKPYEKEAAEIADDLESIREELVELHEANTNPHKY